MVPAWTELAKSSTGNVSDQPLDRCKEWEFAYENWFSHYLNQSGKFRGVYSPTGNMFTVRFGDKVEKSEEHLMRRLLMQFTFFPGTKTPCHRRFASDQEAMLNDWVMIGSDLYGAIQQYKIESHCVRTDRKTTDTPAAAAW